LVSRNIIGDQRINAIVTGKIAPVDNPNNIILEISVGLPRARRTEAKVMAANAGRRMVFLPILSET